MVFGVPVTDAGGNIASSTADIGTAVSTRAETVDTRCHTPGAATHGQQFGHGDAAGDRDAAEVVADQVDDHDVLGDVLDRRAQRRRCLVERQRALDGARVDRVADAPQEQFGRERGDRAPVSRDERRTGGRGARDGFGEEVDGRTADLPDELRAHARLVHLACRDGVEAGQHPGMVGVPVGVAPGDVAGQRSARLRSTPRSARPAPPHRKGFRTTRFRHGPDAVRHPSSRPRPRGCVARARRPLRRDRTGTRSIRRRPARRLIPVQCRRRRRSRPARSRHSAPAPRAIRTIRRSARQGEAARGATSPTPGRAAPTVPAQARRSARRASP